MKATVEVTVRPFEVPEFVYVDFVESRTQAWPDTPRCALSDLDVETLDALCNDFRAGVFRKAGGGK
jgi:hypothetical protein